MSAPPALRAIPSPRRLLVLLTFAFAVLAGSAMLYTSTTFDEIVFSAVGARGLRTGDFGMVSDHPRLPQYLFGLPLHLSGARLPPEEIVRVVDGLPHYQYARAMFWGAGNDAERIAIWPRLVGLAFGVLTVLAAFSSRGATWGRGRRSSRRRWSRSFPTCWPTPASPTATCRSRSRSSRASMRSMRGWGGPRPRASRSPRSPARSPPA